MISYYRVDWDIFEDLVKFIVHFYKTFGISFFCSFPNTVVNYVAGEVNVRDILTNNYKRGEKI